MHGLVDTSDKRLLSQINRNCLKKKCFVWHTMSRVLWIILENTSLENNEIKVVLVASKSAFKITKKIFLIASINLVKVTDRGGEMSCSLDMEQLLVDDLQVLGTPLTGAINIKQIRGVIDHRCA